MLTKGNKPSNDMKRRIINQDAQQVKEAEFRAGWKNPILTQLDDLYPVSRTNRILRKSEFSSALKTLVDTFHILNLHTTYFNSPNVGASCRSLDQVYLAVNLWESLHDPDCMILEIYRISGDTIVYHEYVRRIFGGVAGNRSSPSDGLLRKRALATRNTRSSFNVRGTPLPASSSNVSDALRPVWRMLLDEHLDSRRRGLESLVMATDISKTSRVVATGVANVLLRGSDQSMKGYNMIGQLIHQTVFHLASFRQWPDSDVSLDGKLAYVDKLNLHLALEALANASALLMDASPEFLSLSVRDAAAQIVDEQSFGLAMEYYVTSAQKDPHAAYLALRIWTFLSGVQSTDKYSRLTPDSVRRAQQIGLGSHEALEVQARRLLATLKK